MIKHLQAGPVFVVSHSRVDEDYLAQMSDYPRVDAEVNTSGFDVIRSAIDPIRVFFHHFGIKSRQQLREGKVLKLKFRHLYHRGCSDFKNGCFHAQNRAFLKNCDHFKGTLRSILLTPVVPATAAGHMDSGVFCAAASSSAS